LDVGILYDQFRSLRQVWTTVSFSFPFMKGKEKGVRDRSVSGYNPLGNRILTPISFSIRTVAGTTKPEWQRRSLYNSKTKHNQDSLGKERKPLLQGMTGSEHV
jgi:hypothetical protein